MLLSVHIRADMRSKRYFRSGYIVFRGILGQLRVLSRMTLLSTFSTQFSTFRVVLVFPRRFKRVSGEDIAKNGNKKRASRPSCARNTGRLLLLCGSCWGVLSESGS
jgi:hypothetical protein